MRNIIENEKKYRIEVCLCLMVLFFFSMFFYRNAVFETNGDDALFKSAITTYGSWADWAEYHYNYINGRVLIHGVLIFLLNLPVIVWRTVSSVTITATCYKIADIALLNAEGKRWILLALAAVASLFFLIPGSILGDSVKWAAGSLNYLFPVCCLLWALAPFMKKIYCRPINIVDKICAVLAVFMCGNMEQSAAVFAAMGVLIFLFILLNREKYECKDCAFLIVLLVLGITTLVCSYTAPAVSVRFSLEMMKCSGYGMYSVVERFILGVQSVFMNFFYIKSIGFWLLPSLILLITGGFRRNLKEIVISAANIFFCAVQFVLMRKVYSTSFIYPFDLKYYLWVLFMLFLIIMNGYIVTAVIKNYTERYLYLFLYLGAVAAIVVTGFAPTVFVSTHRTAYISHILFVLIDVKLIIIAIRELKNNNVTENDEHQYPLLIRKLSSIYLSVGTVVSIFFVLVFYFTVQHGYTVQATDYLITSKYNTTGLDYNNRGYLEFILSVKGFEYSKGDTDGYDINVQIGTLETDSGNIHVNETVLISEWPSMFKYPNDEVLVKTNCKGASPEEKLVLLITAHDGTKYMQYLDEE